MERYRPSGLPLIVRGPSRSVNTKKMGSSLEYLQEFLFRCLLGSRVSGTSKLALAAGILAVGTSSLGLVARGPWEDARVSAESGRSRLG